ncbi:TIGR03089 family protein [Glutamicibacter protophormiae]|nr:TIGR03089 family protein [Glutamicibacter protophormiae]
MGRTPNDLAGALAAVSERPTPALVWRDGAERVELSGRVLVNWVEKSAGLLVDELDVTAGDTIRISPAPHWRLVVLSLAALRVGARVEFAADADAVLHARLEGHDDDAVAGTELVVATPALAFACSEPLPEGAVDFCAEVRAQPDVYTGFEEPDPSAGALPSGTTHGQLLGRALETAPQEAVGTVFLPLADGWEETALLTTLGIMVRGGAVLLTAGPQDATEDVLSQERATRL